MIDGYVWGTGPNARPEVSGLLLPESGSHHGEKDGGWREDERGPHHDDRGW